MSGISFLKILTCGSVDDGKSTLIGRLLYDCKVLYEDQLCMLDKERTEEGFTDFSCLLDGLLSEREQAITIDVAYRTFTIKNRRYTVIDAPGHEQYTRNMVTGASHADVSLLLIDATKGLLPQTKRHTCISNIMGIRNIIVVVNKMDKCAYSKKIFSQIEDQYRSYVSNISFDSVKCIPVSALHGDNVCLKQTKMTWYSGPTLLELLENTQEKTSVHMPFRMPVQWVARTSSFRGLSGTIIAGSIQVGQEVTILPAGVGSKIQKILTFDGQLTHASAEQAVCIQLADDVDAGRGSLLVSSEALPEIADQFVAHVIWMGEPPLVTGRTYLFRIGTTQASATITEISSQLEIETLQPVPAKQLLVNQIGRIKVSLDRPLPLSPYNEHKDMGSFLLIDKLNGKTMGAGMVDFVLRRSHTIHPYEFELSKTTFSLQKGQKSYVLWFTGLSGSGKSTLANLVAKQLYSDGYHIYTLDGDNLRRGLNRDLGFIERDRAENIRRASEVAWLMADAGLIVLASFISPFRNDRAAIRDRFLPGEFFEIFIDTPLNVCESRDPKGLYKLAREGKIPNFTGVSALFEHPEDPDLHLDGTKSPEELVCEVMHFLSSKNLSKWNEK